jgi:hypothetical protein
MKFMASIILSALVSTISLQLEADPSRGRETFKSVLGRKMQVSYDVILNKQELTVFRVSGDDVGDIDCFLYDEHDELVAKDDRWVDSCMLSARPTWTGHFTFVVRNYGNHSDSFSGAAF